MGASRSRETTCCGGIVGSNGGGTPASPEPLRVAVSGAAGQIGYSLLPMIASGRMFGPEQRIILQCLDLNLPVVKENMRGIEMELQDGNFPLLHQAVFSTDDSVVFRGADYAILLGAFPRQDGRDKREAMEKNVLIFRTMGHAIQDHAKRGCKVLVVGNPSSTNALICSQFAPQLPKENFFAFTRLDHNRASGQIALRAQASAGDVKNVVIWGAHAKLPDVEHCLVDGRPIREVLSKPEDQRWLKEEFPKEMLHRGVNIHKARKASSAMSTSRAIVDHVHDLHFGTRSGEFVSMGVWSDGNEYGIASGLVFSMPIVCLGRGRYRVASGLKLSPATKDKMREIEADLLADRELAKDVFSKHGASGS
mmetsp:Transcript_2269/g.5121  ORF Transcript_2269/g.5121 Transcript_2269/m.5121 type:complete len:365 (-) Transcript_2269:245-1339(-)